MDIGMTENKIGSSEKQTVRIAAKSGETLLMALEEQGFWTEGGCRGGGRCGKCRVRFPEGAPFPSAVERRLLTPEELRAGVRLACLHRADRPCRVEVDFARGPETEVVTETVGLEDGPFAPLSSAVCATSGDGDAGDGGESEGDASDGGWCIAVDLGTTTVAMQARSLGNGAVLAEWTAQNPQRRFGADVVSRMQAAQDGQGEALQKLIREALETGVCRLTRQVGRGDPAGVYVAGNTVMEHLLAGLPVEGLARYPFTPVTLEEQHIPWDSRAKEKTPWTLLPGISAFVGADLLAGTLACGMHRRREITLLLDLGTNGELVLGNRERLLCAATAAGPAFEGTAGTPERGTDRIAVIGQLLEEGVIEKTGLLKEPWFETGYPWELETGTGASRWRVTQEDIRALQKAKAAIHAGICVLMRKYGITCKDISAVWLAGGFGYFLDTHRAAQIGLFPAELREKVKAVGNTSLAGAFVYGRSDKTEAEEIRRISRAVNLAQEPDFETLYLEHLNF